MDCAKIKNAENTIFHSAVEDLYGCGADEVINKNVDTLLHDTDIENRHATSIFALLMVSDN
jgi:hypothetical protein